MKRKIIISRQYKKDIKLARRRNLPEEELNEIVLSLANDIPLPAKNKDHALQGEFAGCRECHIRPDWLLIYSKESDGELHILNLLRTGTHSDLFKKYFNDTPSCSNVRGFVVYRRFLYILSKISIGQACGHSI